MPSKSRSVHLAFFVSILLTMSSAHGQGVLSISTDKSEYAHGEPIEIHIVISNPTTETFTLHGSSSCQVWFRFDDFDAAEHSICTLDALEIQYPPGTERNYYFTVDPAVLGLPVSDGTHNVVGYWAEMSDSTTVSAPAYDGGRVAVGFENTTSQNDVAALKDSLGVSVVESYDSGQGITEIWEISGASIDSTEATYQSDSRFRFFEAYRLVPNHTIISRDDVEVRNDHPIALSVFPNPCQQNCTVETYSSALGVTTLSLVDVIGRTVAIIDSRQFASGQKVAISLRRPPGASGLYFLVARSRDSVNTAPVLFVD